MKVYNYFGTFAVLILTFGYLSAFASSHEKQLLYDLAIATSLQGEAAIEFATDDLLNAFNDLSIAKCNKRVGFSIKDLSANSIVVMNAEDAVLVEKMGSRLGVEIPQLSEDGFIIKTVNYKKKPLILICGNGVRGATYGVFRLIERMKLDHKFISGSINIHEEPDMTWRMITQPFEAVGYPEVATLDKPIIQHLNREFDPIRPWEGAGYDPEDEARNILRSGLNAMWVGNFSFATDYRGYDRSIFPEGSDAGEWVRERQQKIAKMVAAAEKYHLKSVASSDIFIYPKGQDPEKKWEMLEYSLDEFFENFPEVDMISTRFGENYSYFNNYFVGSPLEGDEQEAQFHIIIDFIHKIVSDKYGKLYMPRTWACGNTTWGSNADNYKAVVDRVQARDNIIFSVKNTRTDFWRYNRYNPIIGTGDYEQAIEYLCQDSYHFKTAIPYYDVIRMAKGSTEFGEDKGIKESYQSGTRTVWGWLTADGWCGPYLKREEWLRANIYGFSKLAWDVDYDPRDLAQQWAALEFGVEQNSRVAENIADILMLSESMIIKSRYFREHSLRHEGWLPSNNWMRDELIGGGESSNNRLSEGKSFSPGTLKSLFNPETVDLDIKEKEEAEAIMNSMLLKFETIKGDIPDPNKAEEVYNTLLYGQYLVATIRYYVSGMFRYYNGEYQRAASDLREWKVCWDCYNNEIQALPGVPTLILDGGMVETCNNAMAAMQQSY